MNGHSEVQAPLRLDTHQYGEAANNDVAHRGTSDLGGMRGVRESNACEGEKPEYIQNIHHHVANVQDELEDHREYTQVDEGYYRAKLGDTILLKSCAES